MQVAQGRLGFKLLLSDEARDASVTAHAGLPLIVEAALAVFPKKLWRRLAVALGYEAWRTVRRHVLSVMALQVAGGDSVDDVQTLRADLGLGQLLGFELSSATQLKDFLYRFHQAEDGRALTDEDDAALSVVGKAQVRPEGPGLRALADLAHAITRALHQRSPSTRATLDADATIIEAWKKQALYSYEGPKGYQPQMAWWAERQLFVCDEFRDGNVPAAFQVKAFLERAFAALPAGITERRLRADSAFYDEEGLSWMHRSGIWFTVSADMSPQLQAAAKALPEHRWEPYRSLTREDEGNEERQWAEVEFVPEWKLNKSKQGPPPLRYVAIRIRSRQKDLVVPDAERWRHFAVVTNMKWSGENLLRWHREKQGTVEQGHDLLKNELAGGVMPCGRFCANAAWWRLTVLTANLLQYTKVVALPETMHTQRPKALRYRLFNIAGRLTNHGRQLWLRICSRLPVAEIYGQARSALRALPEPAA